MVRKMHVISVVLLVLIILIVPILFARIYNIVSNRYKHTPNDTVVMFFNHMPPHVRPFVKSFINRLTDADKHARPNFRDSDSTNASYLDSYVMSSPPTRHMKQTVQGDIDAVIHELRKKQFTNTFVKLPWKICFLGDQIENNLPHTHHDTIFLPRQFHKRSPEYRQITILHEQIHVFQRLHPVPTHNLFLNHWALSIVGIRTHEEPHDSTLRSNPDLNRLIYSNFDPVLNSYASTDQIYTSNTPDSIVDARLKKVQQPDVTQVSKSSQTQEDTKKDTTYFDLIQEHNMQRQAEHPNEVMAYLIPKLVLQDASHEATERWMRQYL